MSGDAGRAKADRAGVSFMLLLSNVEALNPGEKGRFPAGDRGARGSGGMFCGHWLRVGEGSRMGDCSRAGDTLRRSCSRIKLRLLPDTRLSIGVDTKECFWGPSITDLPRCNDGRLDRLSSSSSFADGTRCKSGWLPRSKLGEDERELCIEGCLLRSFCMLCEGD